MKTVTKQCHKKIKNRKVRMNKDNTPKEIRKGNWNKLRNKEETLKERSKETNQQSSIKLAKKRKQTAKKKRI